MNYEVGRHHIIIINACIICIYVCLYVCINVPITNDCKCRAFSHISPESDLSSVVRLLVSMHRAFESLPSVHRLFMNNSMAMIAHLEHLIHIQLSKRCVY